MEQMNYFSARQITARFYNRLFEPIVEQYHLTQMEMDVLLFLANQPQYDTAADLVRIRCLTKSHVSLSVEHLAKRGYLDRTYAEDNRKTIHLHPTAAAAPLIEQGRECQKAFFDQLLTGVSKQECVLLWHALSLITDNAANGLQRLSGEGE